MSEMMKLEETIGQVSADPEFIALDSKYRELGVKSWLEEREKCLLYSIGAFGLAGDIIEIGSYCGGSAVFLAGGLLRRAQGRLHAIDPHLGGPSWLGMHPVQRTLEAFRSNISNCGVAGRVITHVSESSAIAQIWPAELVSAVLVDGDHSYMGALRDCESWIPKMSPGGLLLIDDADDQVLMELSDFVADLKLVPSIAYEGIVGGIAVFRRVSMDSWAILRDLQEVVNRRGITRDWDFERLHQQGVSKRYLSLGAFRTDSANTVYQLAYLARCGPGDYGFTRAVDRNDMSVLNTVAADRGDGRLQLIEMGTTKGNRFRAIWCALSEVTWAAPLLQPGGVLFARGTEDHALKNRKTLLEAGLEGCDFQNGVQWGVWRPGFLSREAIMFHSSTASAGH